MRQGVPASEVDEVIFGNVAQPADSANIARVIALRAGVPISTPASTVHRNCASGMEAITTAFDRIRFGYCDLVAAGGVQKRAAEMLNIKPTTLNEMIKRHDIRPRRRRGAARRGPDDGVSVSMDPSVPVADDAAGGSLD